MRCLLRPLNILLLALAIAPAASALPIKINIKELLRQGQSERVPMMPARVGWRGDAGAQPARNLVYERLMYPETPQGVREQWRELARPPWGVLVGVFGLIICLRLLRDRDLLRRSAKARVITMPEPRPELRAA